MERVRIDDDSKVMIRQRNADLKRETRMYEEALAYAMKKYAPHRSI